MKYNVGDCVKFDYKDIVESFNGIGKIIEVGSKLGDEYYLIELPKKYHGKGHKGNRFSYAMYDERNYWFITDKDILGKVDTKEGDTMGKDLVKGADLQVQNVYKAVTDKKGNITFNPVEMVNICFVKFDGNDKVYMFNNPTDKRLKTGTKVLVDSAGSDTVATVVSSIKIQEKYLGSLRVAMGNKKQYLKNVLGVYETKTVKVEELIELGGAA